MKIKILFILLYLLALQVLLSVRAMKLVFSNETQTTCNEDFTSKSDCEKGNFIMDLNFSAIQFVAEFSILKQQLIHFYFYKKKSYYKNTIHINKISTAIWHPPKFFHFINLV